MMRSGSTRSLMAVTSGHLVSPMIQGTLILIRAKRSGDSLIIRSIIGLIDPVRSCSDTFNNKVRS